MMSSVGGVGGINRPTSTDGAGGVKSLDELIREAQADKSRNEKSNILLAATLKLKKSDGVGLNRIELSENLGEQLYKRIEEQWGIPKPPKSPKKPANGQGMTQYNAEMEVHKAAMNEYQKKIDPKMPEINKIMKENQAKGVASKVGSIEEAFEALAGKAGIDMAVDQMIQKMMDPEERWWEKLDK